MKKKVIKTILIIMLFTLSFIGSYLITYSYDKINKKDKDALIEVVFEDTDYYLIPNSEVLNEEDALKEWPYKFKVTNSGNTKGLYQIIIEDDSKNDLERKNLSYILFLDNKVIQKGKLKDIKNNILYEGDIKSSKEQNYQLFIYKDSKAEGSIYKYRLKLNAILDGGPGFKK